MSVKEIVAEKFYTLRYIPKIEEVKRTDIGFMGVYNYILAQCDLLSHQKCHICHTYESHIFYLKTPEIIHHQFDADFESVLLGTPPKGLPLSGHKLDILGELHTHVKNLAVIPIPVIRTDEIKRVR